MSDEEARATFRALRWYETEGEPVCPHCGCMAVNSYKCRPIFKCKGCGKQFSITSGTMFHSRKLPVQIYLMAIAIFVNAVKGVSSLQLSRDLDVQYKTAFVLSQKLRETMRDGQDEYEPKGDVEIDGCYIGGHVKPTNYKENRRDRRLAENQNGKRRVVVAMRERGGRVLPFVKSEAEGVDVIRDRVADGSTVYADEASVWDELHAKFDTKRINHGFAFSDDGACTNQVESYFSLLRRAEFGQHNRISGKYLAQYAGEMAWREDMRREANGTQWARVGQDALNHPKSVNWCGYWQRAD